MKIKYKVLAGLSGVIASCYSTSMLDADLEISTLAMMVMMFCLGVLSMALYVHESNVSK